jgi:probable rRNA maturation factor
MDLEIRNLQARPVEPGAFEHIAERILAAEARQLDVISLVFVDDERMRGMNRAYRGLDAPTDVLSFEAETDEEGLVSGEIIIAVPTAERQAQAAGHPLDRELAWLFAHGLLHVLGYDDETEAGLEAMIAGQHAALVAP